MISFILIAIAVTFTVTVIYSMNSFDSMVMSVKERSEMYTKLEEIDDAVRNNYYAPLDDDTIIECISNGYISGLNPGDAEYLSASRISSRNIDARGSMIGTGMVMKQDSSGYMVVTDIVTGSPAENTEIQKDDIVVSINGISLLPLTEEESLMLLDGNEGDILHIVTSREGEETESEIEIAPYVVPSVASTFYGDIYYIHILSVCSTTASQFENAVNEARKSSDTLIGLVIDLRGVFGGHNLEYVANMLDILLPTGTMISGVFRDGVSKVLYTSNDTSFDMPIGILIDENTKGYTEMFAAVMAENANVTTLGMITAGEGKYRQLQMLSDGTGIDLAVAVLETPKAKTYDGVGVIPDIEYAMPEGMEIKDLPEEATDIQFSNLCDHMRNNKS